MRDDAAPGPLTQASVPKARGRDQSQRLRVRARHRRTRMRRYLEARVIRAEPGGEVFGDPGRGAQEIQPEAAARAEGGQPWNQVDAGDGPLEHAALAARGPDHAC